MDNPWRDRGTSVRQRRIAELALVILAIAVLTGVLAWRVGPLLVAAERAAVQTDIGQLRSALGARVAERVAQGRQRSLAELADTNPAKLIEGVPSDYAGTVAGHGGALQAGRWYYDADNGWLRYKVRNPGAFWSAGDPGDEVQLRIALSFEDRNGNGRYDGPPESVHRVALVSRHEYCWCEVDEEGGDERDTTGDPGLAR